VTTDKRVEEAWNCLDFNNGTPCPAWPECDHARILKEEMDRARKVVVEAEDILECPITPDTATYNQGRGIDSAPPYQAVVMVSCSWTRWKALTKAVKEYRAAPAAPKEEK
jgi:hypothetical protein